MKSSFVLLALTSAPWLVSAPAQAQSAPVRIAKAPKAPQAPLPDAQELMDNLWAPYQAARTFRGKFDISIKAEGNAIAQIQLETRFRTDENDRLQRQFSRMKIVGRGKPKEQQTILFVDDGQTQQVVLVEQKVWWKAVERDNAAALFSMVKPLVDQVVQALENDDDFVPGVSRGTASGRPTLLLSSQKNKDLRAVLDEPTRALRSLAVRNTIDIDATNQVFDGPMTGADFAWSAPADYRQVAPGEVLPPASLGITIPSVDGATQAAN